MATVDREISVGLALADVDTFLSQGQAANVMLERLNQIFEKVSNSVAKTDFSKFNLPDSKKIESTARAMDNFGKALDNLGKSNTGSATQNISSLLKSIENASSKKIIDTARSVTAFFNATNRLKEIKISGFNNELSRFLKVFDEVKPAEFEKFGKSMNQVVNTLHKVSKVQPIENAVFLNITQFGKALSGIANLDIDKISSSLPKFTSAILKLGNSFKNIISITGDSTLTNALDTVIKELNKFVTAMKDMGTGDSGKVTKDITAITKAILSFSKSIKVLGEIDTLKNLETNFAKTVTAFKLLSTEFNKFSGANTLEKNIFPAVQAIDSLAKSFTSLSRRKGFSEFPQTVGFINQAIKTLDVRALLSLKDSLQGVIEPISQLATLATNLRIVKKAIDDQKNSLNESNVSTNVFKQTLESINSSIQETTSRMLSFVKAFAIEKIQQFTQYIQNLSVMFGKLILNSVIIGIVKFYNAIKSALSTVLSFIQRIATFIKNLNLLSRALSLIQAPFKFLLNFISVIVQGFIRLGQAVSNVISKFNPFSSLLSKNNKVLSDSAKSAHDLEFNYSKLADSSNNAISSQTNLGNSIDGVGESGKRSTGILKTFYNILTGSGVENAVNRLSLLTASFKAMDVLGRAAATTMRFLSTQIQNLVGSAFTSAAELEKLTLSITVLQQRELFKSGQFDTLDAAFETAQTSAQGLIDKFQSLAIASPFNRDDIAQAFKLAQAYGFSTDAALNLTQVVTDTAAAFGLEGHAIRELILPLGQMASTGRASLEDLKQLAERGIPVFEQLSAAMEVDRVDLFEMISDGQVDAETAIQAITSALNNDFGGAAAKATTTLGGLLATFQDFVKNAKQKLFQGTFDELRPLFIEILNEDTIRSSLASIEAFGKSISANIRPALEQVIVVAGVMRELFTSIPAPVVNMIKNFAKAGAIILSVSLAFGALNLALVAAASVFFLFVNPISIVAGLLIAIGLNFRTVATSVTNAVEEMSSSFTQLPEFVNEMIEGMNNGFEGLDFTGFTGSLQVIASSVNTILDFSSVLGSNLVTLSNGGNIAANTFSAFSPILQTFGNDILSVASYVNSIVPTFTSAFNTILGTIRDSVNQAGTFFVGMLSNVTEWGSGLISAFADGIISALSIVGSALAELGSLISYWLSPGSPPRLLPDIDKWGTAAASEFLGGFSDADIGLIGDFGDTLTKLLENMDVTGVDTTAITQLFAEAVNQSESGQIDPELFNEIAVKSGVAATEVLTLADKYTQVALEQNKLNEATREYDDALSSAKGKLDALQADQDISTGQKEIGALQGLLNNQFISEQTRQSTLAKISQLQGQNELKALEKKKSLQEASALAATEDLERQKTLLDLAGKFAVDEAGAGGGAGGSDALGKAKKPKKEKEEKTKIEKLSSAIEDINAAVEGIDIKSIESKYESAFGGLQDKVTDAKDKVTSAFQGIKDNITGIVTNIQTKMEAWGITTERLKLGLIALTIAVSSPLLIGSLGTIATLLGGLLTPFGLLIAGVAGLAIGFGVLVFQTGSITGAIDKIKESFTTFAESFKAAFTTTEGGSLFDAFTNIDATSIASLGTTIGTALGLLVTDIETRWANFVLKIKQIFSGQVSIMDMISGAFFGSGETDATGTTGSNSPLSGIALFFTKLKTDIENNITTFTENIKITVNNLLSGENSIVSLISNAIFSVPEVSEDSQNLNFLDRIKVSIITAVTNFKNQVKAEIDNNLTGNEVGEEVQRKIDGAEVQELSIGGNLSFAKSIADILTNLNTYVAPLVEGIQTFFDSISTGFEAGSGGSEASGGILGNILAQNKEAFSEFISEITSPAFQTGLQNIGFAIGIVSAAILGLVAAIADAALIAILRNVGDIVIKVGAGIDSLKLAFSLFQEGDYLGSFGAAFSGVMEILDGTIGVAINTVADFVKTLLEFVGIDTSGWIGTTIDALVNLAAIFLGGGGGGLTKIFSSTGKLVKTLFNIFREPGALASLAFRFGAVTEKISSFRGIILLIKNLLTGTVKAAFKGIEKTVKSFTTDFGNSSEAVKDAIGVLGSLRARFITVKNTITNFILSLGLITLGYNGLIEAFGIQLPDPYTAIQLATDTFKTTLSNIKLFFDGIVTSFANPLANPFLLITGPIDLAVAGLETLSTVFGSITTALGLELPNPFEALLNAISPVTDAIDGFLEKFNLIGGLGEKLGINVGGGDVQGADELAQSTRDKVKASFDASGLEISPKITLSDDGTLSASAKSLLDTFQASYKENAGLLGTDFAAINKDLLEAGFTAADLATLAQTAGIEIPAGLAAGMADEAGELPRASRQMATDVLQQIQEQLQIESPSQLVAAEAGAYIPAGLAQGITDNLEPITIAVSQMVDGVLQSLTERTSMLGSGNVFEALFSFNGDVLVSTNESINTLLATYTIGLNVATELFVDYTKTGFEIFEDFYKEVTDLTKDFMEIFLELMRQFVDDVITEFVRMVDGAIEEVKRLRSAVMGELRGLLADIRALSTEFEAAGKELGASLIKGIADGIKNNASKVGDALAAMLTGLLGGPGGLISVFEESGKDLGAAWIDGIVDYIKGRKAQQAVENAAAGTAETLDSSFRETSQIASPSKTAMRLAEQWVDGIVLQIDASQQRVAKSSANLAQSIITSSQNTLEIRSPSKKASWISSQWVNGLVGTMDKMRGKVYDASQRLHEMIPTDIMMSEVPVDVKYNGLMNSLPSLSQDVMINRVGHSDHLPELGMNATMPYARQFEHNLRSSLIQTLPMTQHSSTHVTHNTNQTYNWNVTQTPQQSMRAEHGFKVMRVRRRLR